MKLYLMLGVMQMIENRSLARGQNWRSPETFIMDSNTFGFKIGQGFCGQMPSGKKFSSAVSY
jgi:hypothetical protein